MANTKTRDTARTASSRDVEGHHPQHHGADGPTPSTPTVGKAKRSEEAEWRVAPKTPLQKFLAGAAERRGSAKRLAAAIGISLTGLSRGARNGTFNLKTCLKIAEATGERPEKILRLAGKNEIANQFVRLFAPSAEARLSRRQREFLNSWKSLSRKQQGAMLEILKMLIAREQ